MLNESIYATPGNFGGVWEDDQYIKQENIDPDTYMMLDELLRKRSNT